MSSILIIEDETPIADILADNLQDEGYTTLHAADGSSGLRCWQTERPNLVILDVMLPHLSGYEVCRTMRERGDTTPVLFLSAKGQADDRVQGLRAGGDDYLPKPFHLPEFLLRVENMLRRQRWGQRCRAANGRYASFRRTQDRFPDVDGDALERSTRTFKRART